MKNGLLAAAKAWLALDPDTETQQELESLIASEDADALSQRFSGRLAFGTAGLRGTLGAGPMRMNRVVVRQTSYGFGRYLLQQVPDAAERGIVLGHDARIKSDVFAADAAEVFTALGIKVHWVPNLAATPIVAFAVSELNAAGGVMVTASHNPPNYNGYKVYWGNGAQIIPPHDKGIAQAIEAGLEDEIPRKDFIQAQAAGEIEELPCELLASYYERVLDLLVLDGDLDRANFPIAYSAMHGVGERYVRELLHRAGYAATESVESQAAPDGTFPTVDLPNPEEPAAMAEVVALAKRIGAPIAVANDPDADRVAVVARDRAGKYRQLTGDQVGILLGMEQMRLRPQRAMVGTTVVSSRMLARIAHSEGVKSFEVLTGFKWIANRAMDYESSRSRNFLFGYEEAIGYTIGNIVRDKDGVSTVLAVAELACRLYSKGKTLFDALEALYRKHGYHLSRQKSLALDPTYAGPSMGEKLRANPPKTIAGLAVSSYRDLLTGIEVRADGGKGVVDLPSSDVLIYFLEDESRVVVRPSGTEPKLKCYYEIIGHIDPDESGDAAYTRLSAQLDDLVAEHQKELAEL